MCVVRRKRDCLFIYMNVTCDVAGLLHRLIKSLRKGSVTVVGYERERREQYEELNKRMKQVNLSVIIKWAA